MTMIQPCERDSDESSYRSATHPPCEHHDACEPCNDLTEIEAEIEDVHSRLKDLHERHRQARARRNLVHNGPLIHQLPPEIVIHIFALAFPLRGAFRCNDPGKEVSPLILAKVCHTWRELAFSTPRLWCSISVDVSEPNLPLLNHQVAHSGVMPLSISFFFSDLDDDSDDDDSDDDDSEADLSTLSTQAMSSVIQQLHRTSSLCLNLPDKFITELSVVLGSPNAAPLLEDFHIHSANLNRAFPLKFKAIEPPHQRRVLLEWLHCNPSDWTNISHLTLKNCHIGGALSEILASKDLKHLALEEYGDILKGQTLVVCRSVEILTLGGFDSAEFMFTKTSLPSLRNLEIKVEKMHRLYPMIRDFLHRSLCPLQVLIIHHWGNDTSQESGDRLIPALIDVLKSTNTLQHLTLESYEKFPSSNPEPLVCQLSLERDFLPCLQTLSLRTRYTLPIDLLLNMMTADGDPSKSTTTMRPLRKLNLELWMTLLGVGPFSRDDVLRILQLRAVDKTISIGCALEWALPELASDVVLYWKGKYGL